jgi:DnaK suppressor protein
MCARPEGTIMPERDAPWLAEMQRLLEARRRELMTAIAEAARADAPVAPDKAIGRLTRQDALQQQQMAAALARRQEQELALVQKALRAIDEGRYGECQRCGNPVAPARLRALPHAVLCVECASRWPPGRGRVGSAGP